MNFGTETKKEYIYIVPCQISNLQKYMFTEVSQKKINSERVVYSINFFKRNKKKKLTINVSY